MTDPPRVTTDLYCHGLNTNPRRAKLGHPCGRPLGRVPGELRFSVCADEMPAPDGRAWVQCPKCERWNAFEILAVASAAR